MGKKITILMFLAIVVIRAAAQEYMYVNTDNLILRDRPEKVYAVFAILHAPCRVKVEPYENGYKNDKQVTNRFYQVSISYRDKEGIGHYTGGWVIKKYLVADLDKVTVPGVDKLPQISATTMDLISYGGGDEDNPNKGNGRNLQAPKYKGGEPQPAPVKRKYHLGPRGGCYYLNTKGSKVYVDSKFCKDQ